MVPVIYVAFRRELFGGALISCAGVASIALFNAWEAPVVLLGVSLPLILLGAAFMAAWYLQRVGEGH